MVRRALVVNQQDLVIDAVLLAVFKQALLHALTLGQTGHVGTQVLVGGQKAHVCGALVEVAHHDVDHVVGTGAQLSEHLAERLRHQRLHQIAL